MKPWQQNNPTSNIQTKRQAHVVGQLNQLAQVYACAYGSEWEEVDELDLTAPIRQAAEDLAHQIITWMKAHGRQPSNKYKRTPPEAGWPPDAWVNQAFWPEREQELLDVLDNWNTTQIRHILNNPTPEQTP